MPAKTQLYGCRLQSDSMRLWEYQEWANSGALEFRGMFYALLSDGDAEIRKTMIANLDDCVVNFLSALAETDQDARSKTSGADDESDSARSEFLQELLEQLVKLGESIAVQDPSLAKPKTAGIRSQLPVGAS